MLELLVDGRYDIPGTLNDFTNQEKLEVLKRLNLTLPAIAKERKLERLRAKAEQKGTEITPDKEAKWDRISDTAGKNSLLQLRQVIGLYKTMRPNTRLNRILAMLEFPQADIARIMESPLVDGVRVAPRELWYVTRNRNLVTHMGDSNHFVSCFRPGGEYHEAARNHANQVVQGHSAMVYQIAEDGGLANRFLIRDNDTEIYDDPMGIQDFPLFVDAIKGMNNNVALQCARTLLRLVTNPEDYAEGDDRPIITEGYFPFQFAGRG